MRESITSENKIIKMLKYLFEKDSEALKNILNKAFNKDIKILELIEIKEEYLIGDNKRIDLFISLKIDDISSCIFFEVFARRDIHVFNFKQHYELINDNYKDTSNYFIYLKPKYNKDNNDCFKDINYETIIKSITISDDPYISAFKETMHEHLISKRDEEIDKYLLENIDEIFNRLIRANIDAKDYFKTDLANKIKCFIDYDNLEYKSSNYSIKIYNSSWDNAYIELITLTGDNDIIIQRVVNNEIKDKESFKIFAPFLSDEWKEELFDKSIFILKNMYNKQKEESNK